MSRAKHGLVIGALLLGDMFLTGMGMGVPIFAIFWGAAPGLAAIFSSWDDPLPVLVRRTWLYGLVTVGFTFLMMLAIWTPISVSVAVGKIDPAISGVPFILYEPVPSFWGFIVLMVVVSPVLQLLVELAVVFACISASRRWSR